MARLRLRTGLAVLTVVAVLALLVVGVPAWYDRWTHWRDSDAHIAVAPALERADGALRAEAQRSVRYLVDGEAADRAALAIARVRTDRAVRRLRDRAADAPRAVRAATATLVADWSRWQTARADIDRRTMPDDRALERLQTLADDGVGVADALAALPHVASTDRRAIAQLARARAALAAQQRDLTVALSRVQLTPATLDSLRSVPGTLAITLDPARRQLRAVGFDFTDFDRAHARTALLARIARGGVVPFWTAADWQARAAAEQTQLDTVVRRALRLTSRVERATRAATWDALRNVSLLLVAAIAFVVAAGVVLHRRVRRPARALTRAVTHTAAARTAPGRTEPPAEIVIPQAAVRAAGDTGALAAAITGLDRATLGLTSSTPAPTADAPVVGLVRHNESLLARQLELLDGLGADESDPDRRQSLARIDRLAARMRRHGDNLLLVAGLEPERRPASPMTIADLVGTAVSEIEPQERIDVVNVPDDVAVTGDAVRDLVHVLAELLENATTFSRPESRVFVRARRRTDGIELTVDDDGIGMPVTRLDAYNEILAHPPAPGPDRPRAVGLIAVAHLCERAGATVRLRSAPDAGTGAVVVLPSRLLEPASVVPERGPVATGRSAVDRDAEPDAERPDAVVLPLPVAPRTASLPDPGTTVGAHTAASDDGVHFTAVPVARPGDPLTDGGARPPYRRGRRRPSTGTLHRAPAPRRTEATPLGGNE